MIAIPDFSTAAPGLIEETLAEHYGEKVATQPTDHILECKNVKDLYAE